MLLCFVISYWLQKQCVYLNSGVDKMDSSCYHNTLFIMGR